MNLVLAAAIVLSAVAIGITAMLVVRRRAPVGGHFTNGDRAAGVFGVLATGFSVLLGFIVFLAFSSYDASRTGAEDEARIVAQQVETAQLLPPAVSPVLTGDLVCYARSVAGVQWKRMENGTLAEGLNPWGARMFRTIEKVEPRTASEQAAYSKWLDQTSDREAARNSRIHGAVGVIPTPLWLVIFFTSVVILLYMLFFADRGEGPFVQALMMGSVVGVIVAMLLLLQFLDNPFHPGVGGLKPVAMERTVRVIDQERRIAGLHLTIPCDAEGRALPSS